MRGIRCFRRAGPIRVAAVWRCVLQIGGQVSGLIEHFFDVDVTKSQGSLNSWLASERYIGAVVRRLAKESVPIRVTPPQGLQPPVKGIRITMPPMISFSLKSLRGLSLWLLWQVTQASATALSG